MKEFLETYLQHQEDIEYFFTRESKKYWESSFHKKKVILNIYIIFSIT